MTKITIEHATFSYDGKTDIFADLTYEIDSEQVFCILGPNGIGKSTLLKAILNLHPLKQGRILLDGKDIRNIAPAALARIVAYIPQTYQFTFPYSVLDLVLMGRTPHLNRMAKPTSKDYRTCADALESLGLAALADRPCTQLSGGQLQLVMLARAIAQEAAYIVLDEPTSHLDFGKQMQTLEVIEDIRERGMGVIMTTHYPDHAFLVCDTVAIMQRGRFVAIGSPDEVVTEENLRDIYGVDIQIADFDCGGFSRKVCVPVGRSRSDAL